MSRVHKKVIVHKISFPYCWGLDFPEDELNRVINQFVDSGNYTDAILIMLHNQLVINQKLNQIISMLKKRARG